MGVGWVRDVALTHRQNVKIVYIGTLHQQHHDDVTAALNAGKHVLVEKPAVLNAAEWADLSALAKKKNLFLMEGEREWASDACGATRWSLVVTAIRAWH